MRQKTLTKVAEFSLCFCCNYYYNVWERKTKKLKREKKLQLGLRNVRWQEYMKLLGQVVSLRIKETFLYRSQNEGEVEQKVLGSWEYVYLLFEILGTGGSERN